MKMTYVLLTWTGLRWHRIENAIYTNISDAETRAEQWQNKIDQRVIPVHTNWVPLLTEDTAGPMEPDDAS